MMETAPRLKQHDNLQKQITAYKRLLQHAMSRFSKDKLYQMLRLAHRGLPEMRAGKIVQKQQDQHGKIASLRQMKDIVETLQNKKRKGIHREEELHMIKYFDTFFKDLEYLKDLKKYFDEKIYLCLYEYFYDPADDTFSSGEKKAPDFKGVADDTDDSGNSSMNHSDDERFQKAKQAPFDTHTDSSMVPNLDTMTDKERLYYAVKELYKLNQKWDSLFNEEELPISSFDPDSHHELLQFTNYSSFEPVLRLVPDVFVKAYKSVELAKTWWTQADKVYKELPGKKNSTKEFVSRVSNLEEKIRNLAREIVYEKDMLLSQQRDLQRLLVRENRCNELTECCERVEELKMSKGEEYNALLSQREHMKRNLAKTQIDSPRYHELSEKISDFDEQVMEAYGELKILSYHYEILQEDFNLELEMRPDIIRFISSLKEDIQTLEESLQDKITIRRKAEKELVLLKTNTEKMREIMRRFLNSRESEVSGGMISEKTQVSISYDENQNTQNIKTGTSDQTPPNGHNRNNNYRDPNYRHEKHDKHSEIRNTRETKRDFTRYQNGRPRKSRNVTSKEDIVPTTYPDGNEADIESPSPKITQPSPGTIQPAPNFKPLKPPLKTKEPPPKISQVPKPSDGYGERSNRGNQKKAKTKFTKKSWEY